MTHKFYDQAFSKKLGSKIQKIIDEIEEDQNDSLIGTTFVTSDGVTYKVIKVAIAPTYTGYKLVSPVNSRGENCLYIRISYKNQKHLNIGKKGTKYYLCQNVQMPSDVFLSQKGNIQSGRASGNRSNYGQFRSSALTKKYEQLLTRCTDVTCSSYKHYKDIEIYDEWLNPELGGLLFRMDLLFLFYKAAIKYGLDPASSTFDKDAGHLLEMDRIDTSLGYTPSNVRFVPHKENCRNKKNNLFLTAYLQGKVQTKTIAEWSEITGLKYGTLYRRHKVLGWSDQEAIFGKSSK